MMIHLNEVLGFVKMDERWTEHPDGIQGESRLRKYRPDGSLREVTPWARTGAILSWAGERAETPNGKP